MPSALINGVRLHYETYGQGVPLVFVHEFAGDQRSWDPQVRFFARRYQVITYNARGYPPSDVPADTGAYSQDHAVEADADRRRRGRGNDDDQRVPLDRRGRRDLDRIRRLPLGG